MNGMEALVVKELEDKALEAMKKNTTCERDY